MAGKCILKYVHYTLPYVYIYIYVHTCFVLIFMHAHIHIHLQLHLRLHTSTYALVSHRHLWWRDSWVAFTFRHSGLRVFGGFGFSVRGLRGSRDGCLLQGVMSHAACSPCGPEGGRFRTMIYRHRSHSI